MKKTGTIIISDGVIFINPINGEVWLSQWQIAGLFEVFISKISSNIRSILKSDVLRENEVSRFVNHSNGNISQLYNFEMITALAFRIHSRNADLFREYLMKRAVKQDVKQSSAFSLN
ncbi:Virulence protein [Bacteroidales bacterium Barb6XT]|nr:Virulence protein [Bacteroidales bacterium Barb6XT]